MLTNPNNNNNYSFNIDHFYKNYMNGPKIFRKREALDPSFIPDKLPHRDAEIEQIAGLTACASVSYTHLTLPTTPYV